jgi:hypothetical protein
LQKKADSYNGKRDACRVVVAADVMGWWMDVFVLQGEFVERLFRGEVRSCGYKKKKW